MELNYKIDMLSDWHVGSGLDSGTASNALVLKDENDLPYIPGKTLKGLLRDAFMEINNVQESKISQTNINNIFGKEIKDVKGNVIATTPGKAFFGNAYLPGEVALEVIDTADYLYKTISSTSIGRNWKGDETEGLAKDKSLRTSEVTMPISLVATIADIDESDIIFFKLAFRWLRHLGVGRNRGLGRCQLTTI